MSDGLESGLDLDQFREEHNRLINGVQNNSDKYVRLPDGDCFLNVRILPPRVKEIGGRKRQVLFQATRVHRLNNRTFHCLKEQESSGRWVGSCPACDLASQLWKKMEAFNEQGRKEDAAKADAERRDIKAAERYYYNVIVRREINTQTGETKDNVGPKVWSCGITLHKKVLNGLFGDPTMGEDALGNITDVKTGRDFKIVKRMVDKYPKYDDSKFATGVTALGNPEQVEGWLAERHDLTEERKPLTFEELQEQVDIHRGLIPNPADGGSTTPSAPLARAMNRVLSAEPTDETASPEPAPASSKAAAAARPAPASSETTSAVEDDFMGVIKELQDL